MKNILCLTVSRIVGNEQAEYNNNLTNEQKYILYEAMAEIVVHSAKHFIEEDFEVHIIRDDVQSYQEIFHKNFQNVYDIWKEDGPNNILYLDNDTLVTAPVSVFGKYKHFQMFNYTDPKSLQGKDLNNKYRLKFDHYLNAGCRYYPSDMNQAVWNLGWMYANDWDYNIWGTEQVIFNSMMYSQNFNHENWIHPTMNFQVMSMPFQQLDNEQAWKQYDTWNGCSYKDAKIMHLHGTRGAGNTLITQWLLWKKITGEEFQFSRVDIKTDTAGKVTGIDIKE